jgi:hypothetical protein
MIGTMKREDTNEERAKEGLAGFWYRLRLSAGVHGEKAPVLVYMDEENRWTGLNMVVCWDDEAPTGICRISMARSEWLKLVQEDRVAMAWDLSGKPIELTDAGEILR